MRRRTLTTTLVALTAAVSLTGCGVGDSIVGLRDAPAERTDTAPLNVDGAEKVAARVLDAATAARGAAGAEAAKAQPTVLAGAALAQAQAATKLGAVSASDPLQQGQRPAGRRDLARLGVAARHARRHPRPGQQDPDAARPHVDGGRGPVQGLRVRPDAARHERAGDGRPRRRRAARQARRQGRRAAVPDRGPGRLCRRRSTTRSRWPPRPSRPRTPTPPRCAPRRRRQVKALGALATFSQAHTPVPQHTIAFRLADGGTVTFGQLTRRDAITASPTAKELVIPANYSKLVGKTTATKNLVINSLENVVMVVPATGCRHDRRRRRADRLRHGHVGHPHRAVDVRTAVPAPTRPPALRRAAGSPFERIHAMSSTPTPPAGIRGAIDLSALSARRAGTAPAAARPLPATRPPVRPDASGLPEGLLVEVTDATFSEVMNRTLQVPAVLVIWSSAHAQTVGLAERVAGVAARLEGRVFVVSADVQTSPAILQAFQPVIVQAFGQLTVPVTFGLLQGQPVPLFPGLPQDDEIRAVLDQLVQAAVQNGITGRVDLGPGRWRRRRRGRRAAGPAAAAPGGLRRDRPR